MRKIIQILTMAEGSRSNLGLVALCDDGSLFVKALSPKDGGFMKWQKLEDIPQDEPKRDFIGQGDTTGLMAYGSAHLYKRSDEYWPTTSDDYHFHEKGYRAFLDGYNLSDLPIEWLDGRKQAWSEGWKLAKRIHAK